MYFVGVLHVRPQRHVLPPAQLDDRLGVAYPRRQAEEDRRVVFLADVERHGRHVLGLLGVGRLEHGDFGELGVEAVVLLVLRGVQARLVGGDDHQPGVHAGVDQREERVGGHVDAHLLHRHDRPRAGERRADGHLQRHLLVDRPLGVDSLKAARCSLISVAGVPG